VHTINRRDYLKGMTAAAAVATPTLTRPSSAATATLPPLPSLPPSDAELRQPDGPLKGYSKRWEVRPKLHALCKTTKGVSTLVDWSRSNNLPFALRSGGHSYEGFSQSKDVVIDTREMKKVFVDRANQTMTVGAGAPLGVIYQEIDKDHFGFPGGSCPTVGVTGHALGGGYGYFARPFGLACDSLQWAELVDANGRVVEASAQQNADLFWALRGGGGGSFGAVTRMRFKIYPVNEIVHMFAKWVVPNAHAVKLVQAWQAWAPTAPKTITTVMGISRAGAGTVRVTCSGNSVGTLDEARHEFAKLTRVERTTPSVRPIPYMEAVRIAANVAKGAPLIGPYPESLFKAKSDYLQTPMSADGIATLLREIVTKPPVSVIFDCYGGAVADIANDATAFAHRKMLYSIQYVVYWTEGNGSTETERIRQLYTAMRPHVSGAAYVNYPDLDLDPPKYAYAQAYWGTNLPRLKQIKRDVDPDNVFHHAQSVPLA
jgi:FAD/FMN-containing dehydrogenase